MVVATAYEQQTFQVTSLLLSDIIRKARVFIIIASIKSNKETWKDLTIVIDRGKWCKGEADAEETTQKRERDSDICICKLMT